MSGPGRRAPAFRRVLAAARAVFARRVLVAALFPLVFCASCAPPHSIVPAPEPSVTLEGEVTLAGEDPLARTLALSDAGGSVCSITSPRFEYELRNLAGLRVRVTGRVTGKAEGVPEFSVESYEMAPVDGRAPLIGAIVARGTALILCESSTGMEYLLSGLLVDALRAHTGCKVWIDGPLTHGGGKEAGGGTIAVEGYGILAAPTGAILAPPGAAVPASSTEATSGRP